MKVRRRLVLLTRFPEPGRVKTRLIPALGAQGAAALHRRLVLRTLRTVESACGLSDAALEIRFEGGTEESLRHWLGDRLCCRPQQQGDLGERMAGAFQESFDTGSEATVMIGSDSPSLTPELLAAAFEKLTSNSVVLGPARDGGYYLIGLTRHLPELFRDMPWGTDRVLSESRRILDILKIKPALLTTLEDIDRPEDLPVWECIAQAEEGGPPSISVIIPALNESGNILATLESVQQAKPHEILVIDGGSSDATFDVAQRNGATVLHSKPGRSRQMNAGAAKASGNLLLLLHADTLLPPRWDSEILRILQDSQIAAGAFEFRVDEEFQGKRMLERAVNWRARSWQLPYGDQGLFLRRSLFEEIGGFANLPVMEDYELVRRLRGRGKIVISSQPATTSGRRWRQYGLLHVTLKNQLLIGGFRLGVSPEKLSRFYRRR